MTEREIFTSALTKEVPAERAAFLDEACAGDAPMRLQVESLLAEHEQIGSFMDAPPPDATLVTHPHELLGSLIGPYKLLEQIGEGGMGVVYMAQQSQPVKRRVALKLIKPGMDTRQVIARFEAERQALALMDHPHIARVFDAGATEAGRPYFVMELVHGIPITDYREREQLDTRQRLGLMIDVCRAVQHAHQKAIIHRDLKPSNVLVTLHDGEAVVKLIDFGVAKALDQELTKQTLFTQFSQLVGTPLYMSPEQAALNAVDIDTRSDVYSLGVLLYELLTGTTPFDRDLLKSASFDEWRRVIREDDPLRPSDRISTLHAAGQSTVSLSRAGDPRKLSELMRGELDWIVMKALEKDRNQRYETASSLAADIQRYLEDEPVIACPPSKTYRFRKFARKHRATLTTVALVITCLVMGVALSGWQAVRATRAEAEAKVKESRALSEGQRAQKEEHKARAAAESERIARQAEAAQRERAEAASKDAIANLQKAREAVDQMLTRVADETLNDVPQMEPVRKALLEDALKFYQGFLQQTSTDPALRLGTGEALYRVGHIYAELDQNADAEKVFQESIVLLEKLVAQFPSVPEYRLPLIESHKRLGNLLIWRLERPQEAEVRLRRALDLQTQLVAEYPDAPYYFNRLVQMEYTLAIALTDVGKLGDAEQGFRRALAMVAENAGRSDYRYHQATALARLSDVLILTDRHEEAEKVIRQSLAIREKLLAEAPGSQLGRHDYAWALTDLGKLLWNTGRFREAEESYRRAKAVDQQLVADFPNVLHYRAALARELVALGKLLETNKTKQDVEPLYRQAWATLTENVRAEVQPDRTWFDGVSLSQKSLVEFLSAEGRILEVEAHYRQALVLWQKLAEQSPAVVKYRDKLAQTYQLLADFLIADNRLEEAEKAISQAVTLLEETLALSKTRLGPDHPDTLWSMNNLAVSYYTLGRHADALKLHEETLAFRKTMLGPNHPDTLTSMHNLARSYSAAERRSEAGHLYEEAVRLVPDSIGAHNSLAWFLATCPDVKHQNAVRAVELAKKAIELAKGGGDWNTLGVAQYRAGQWSEAIRSLQQSIHFDKHVSSFNSFFLAMAHWQLDEKDEARKWYDQAVEWMEKNKRQDEELKRFRAEAADLLEREKESQTDQTTPEGPVAKEQK